VVKGVDVIRGHIVEIRKCTAYYLGDRGSTVVKVLVAGSIPDGVIGIFH
jgi:hypothetical protein